MQNQALSVSREAMEKFSIEKDIAQSIKKEFDSRFGATWHCFVGMNFGSFVTHGMFIPGLKSLQPAPLAPLPEQCELTEQL